MDTKRNQKGQILLITVMLLAAAITVAMTIAFNSTTETQVTKLEEDSQKALSAAEAALESAVRQRVINSTVTIGTGDLSMFKGITGQADTVERVQKEFTTPLLQRDEQYTFYLSSYPALTPSWVGNLDIYFQSEGSPTCPALPALELTFIDAAGNIQKNILDPCNSPEIITGPNKTGLTSGSYTMNDTTFVNKTTAPFVLTDKKVLIVRVLNTATKIGFSGNGTNLAAQGIVITSEAKTQTGVTKKIELFQSHPQIPSDFFVTAF